MITRIDEFKKGVNIAKGVWYNVDGEKRSIDELEIEDVGRYLYHVAWDKDRSTILRNGITRSDSDKWLDYIVKYDNMVFATNTDDEDEWFDFASNKDVWRIDTNKIRDYVWHQDPFTTTDWHVCTDRDIPADAVELFYNGKTKKYVK